MAKKQTKELIKKPDFLIVFVETAYIFIKNNLRNFIIGIVIFFVAALSVYGYTVYSSKQEEKAQSTLFQGIRSFEEYSQTGKQESLTNAENVFQTLIKEKRGKAYQIARLYLATIYTMQGKTEEARALYREIMKNSPDTILKTLAEQALQGLEKKIAHL
jgi:predicted negative regulator of RcsB-dependent stress response